MDQLTTIFEEHRSRLFQIAYGMLGRVAKAEDAVQEAYLRWQKLDLEQIQNPAAYLSTIVSRICLDQLKSAKNRREKYVGPDLPEPLLESDKDNPQQQTELAESLSMALLVVLEKLTPVQRAVFLLHEVFGYNYSEIAGMIGKSKAHCRKIGQRARDHIQEGRPRFDTDKEKQEKLLHSFMEAVQHGNIANLEKMLADDAILYSDGGGKVTAARRPIFGANKIARFMVGIRKQQQDHAVEVEFTEVNGVPGLVVHIADKLHSVWSFEIADGKVQHIYTVLNPDKLSHLSHT
ncbi:RNA polymerase sigma-70 factor [Aliifodinibius sp. S!AR15-10]|uniref:RNA polymerase sigma-70 factor n=1 Tax=Aliifodinibius sp. S!AR15-10 TaxID=2950437 RepID=UPI002866D777|nr:RNA polymerase sigma-70 factor [Aliifodinibius sp. S!AR15-10]MDR8390352.1 RNA polymerase sigma-70 factor [Aliifodinibius sp. S!AR15-10]